ASVPTRDDGPPVCAAADLADDPRIDLALLIVGRRRDPELVEEPALGGVVVLEQRVVRNELPVRLDRLQHRAAHVPEAARQRFADALADLGERVERSIRELSILDALMQHLAGQAGADGAGAGFRGHGNVLHGGLPPSSRQYGCNGKASGMDGALGNAFQWPQSPRPRSSPRSSATLRWCSSRR